MSEIDLKDLVHQVFKHPVYLGHVLDGQDVRICPGEGDIYVGPPTELGGVQITQGGLCLMNPNRAQLDCAAQETPNLLMTTDEVKSNRRLLTLALETLNFAQEHPHMVMSEQTGRDAFDQWIDFVRDRQSKEQNRG